MSTFVDKNKQTIDQGSSGQGSQIVESLHIEQSPALHGDARLVGAKNAVLVIMASLILTEGKSILHNVPSSSDVLQMIALLKDLGAEVHFFAEENRLEVDTSFLHRWQVRQDVMKKMRASVLVMGPLLSRFGKAEVALPGGCLIGARPIDLHLKNIAKMGVSLDVDGDFVRAEAQKFRSARLVLEYPSVGATEQLIMAATKVKGTTQIINASLEPEVLDLITVLEKMGAQITVLPPATIEVQGVETLAPIEHDIMVDRLEAGGLLLAAAITGGSVSIANARPEYMDVFLLKLQEMGHRIEIGPDGSGITLTACKNPQAVSFRTAPYPGFPTDLQAPLMAALCLAEGKSIIHEAVFENRFLHVRELQKMGAQITLEGDRAVVTGVDELYGDSVIARDIRGACSLVLAGLAAKGKTNVIGVHHWQRGYEAFEKKLAVLGAPISLKTGSKIS